MILIDFALKIESSRPPCRGSITMYRTGVAAGHNGHTVFLLKSKKQRVGYYDTFLKQEGCAVRSTVIMMENAYMTEGAWEDMTPSLVEGYNSLLVICDNLQWWMIEIFDGFGVQLNKLSSKKKCADAKILSIKEEGGSSSYNQAFDKHVAKSNKHHM